MKATNNSIEILVPLKKYDDQNILIDTKKCINCRFVSHPNTSVNYCKLPEVSRHSILYWYDACKYYEEREEE